MASFELSRVGSAADVARESRVGKYLPLYLAGLAAGAGIGVALTFAVPGEHATPASRAAAFQSQAAPVPGLPALVVDALPERVEVAGLSAGAALNAFVELPAELLAGLGVPGPAVAVAAEPVPVAPVAVAPVAAPAAPVAPVAPAVAPAAEAPAEEPAPAAAAAPAKPNFYLPEGRAGGITELEQRLLNGINAERAKAGMAAYTYDPNLSRIARIRVQQLVDQGYFDHVDPFGYSMYTELLAHFGYTSYAWAGENLALNNYSVAESPERAVIALMKSPTHRANILAGDFFRVGIGELTTPDGRHFYAMIFLG